MPEQHAFQTNATDRRQKKYAVRKGRQLEGRIRNAAHTVLGTRDGRTLLMHLLKECGIHEVPVAPTGDEAQRYLGRLRFGRFLEDLLEDVSEENYQLMVREDRAFLRNLDLETDVVHAQAATEAALEGE